MYITGIKLADKSQTKKKTPKAGAGFSELLSSSEVEEAQTASAPAVSNTSQLLFMQEVGDEWVHKKDAINQGFDALKYLDNIKAGLIFGTLSRDTLIGLESLLLKFRKNFTDPELSQIIDEIELRAKVEIAKMTRN